ncbi:hypothetical protein A2U01_0058988, partial [Trifolium medium]|nr:hypothetical protein [Trifolium medium]
KTGFACGTGAGRDWSGVGRSHQASLVLLHLKPAQDAARPARGATC